MELLVSSWVMISVFIVNKLHAWKSGTKHSEGKKLSTSTVSRFLHSKVAIEACKAKKTILHVKSSEMTFLMT